MPLSKERDRIRKAKERGVVQPNTPFSHSTPSKHSPYAKGTILSKHQILERLSEFVLNGNIKMVNPVEAAKEINKIEGNYAPVQHQVSKRVQFDVTYTQRTQISALPQLQALPAPAEDDVVDAEFTPEE